MRLIRLLKRELSAEISSWVKKGIIDRQQAEGIAKLYEINLMDEDEDKSSLNVLFILAAFFACLSLLLVVSANWSEIPRWIRFGSLVCLTTAFHISGIYQESLGRKKVSEVWYFMACFVYGISIMLVAQIYHLGAYFPDGVLWWAIGWLLMAIYSKSLPISLAALVLSSIWCFLELKFHFFPWMYPAFFIVAAWVSLFHTYSFTLFIGAVIAGLFWFELLFSWLIATRGNLSFGGEHFFLTAGLFIFLQEVGYFFESYATREAHRNYGTILRLWSLRFGLVSLFIMSFKEPWKELIQSELGHFYHVIGLVGALFCFTGWLHAYFSTKLSSSASRSSLFNIPASFIAFIFVYMGASFSVFYAYREDAIWFQIASNVFLVLKGIWLIRHGISKKKNHYFYSGIGTVIAVAIFRYFDLVGGYYGGALLFFVCAATLYFSAR